MVPPNPQKIVRTPKTGWALLLVSLALGHVAVGVFLMSYCEKWSPKHLTMVFAGFALSAFIACLPATKSLTSSRVFDKLLTVLAVFILVSQILLCMGGVVLSLLRIMFEGKGVTPF